MALPRSAYLKRVSPMGNVIVDGDLITPISEHSDGYRSIFATAVDMLDGLRGGTDLLDAEGIVLIDEIETHLHPRWKMRLMSALRVRCSPSLDRRMIEFSGLVTATGWLRRRDNAW